MSAPPIGMMISTPSTNAIAVIDEERRPLRRRGRRSRSATPKPTITSDSSRLTRCWPLKTTGALENSRNFLPRPASLPNAMTEPEKVIAPTNVPMNSSTRLPAGIGSAMLKARGLLTTATAMSTAARPTSECIAATSSGICVISTRLATNQPISAADGQGAERQIQTVCVTAKVTSTAIAMPTMPNRLPRRARQRVRQALERQDEEDAGDEVEKGDLVGGHAAASRAPSPSVPSS